ncbi:MAG: hypothetical protein PF436_11720 [Prolixibacteraceae bacterium]|nr:hypothetical protein [Prolixibacteraceae bacterium]
MLLFVVFTAIVLAGIVLFVPSSDSKDRLVSKDFWINKTHNSRRFSLVVAGDSRIYRSVSPGEMEKVLEGYRGFNVGYSSAGFANSMFGKIEKHIDFDARKPIVVLGVSPWSLTSDAGENKHMAGELNRKKEELIQAKYFSSVNNFFAPYSLKEVFDKVKKRNYKKGNEYRYTAKGWVASNTDMPNPQMALGHVEANYTGNQMNQEQLQQLAEKISFWEQKGAEVFAFRPPSTRAMEMMEDSLSGYNEQYVAEVLENAGAVWFKFDVENYFSYDGSHLDESSAIRLSHELALKIRGEID